MKRYIYAAVKNAASIINKVGKYLNKNIDGAYKIKFKSNECEVSMRMYYQIPDDPDSFNEMRFIINITSYQNKLRINITEDTPMEKTIGQVILKEEELSDLNLVKFKVMSALKKAIAKEYAEFDFIY